MFAIYQFTATNDRHVQERKSQIRLTSARAGEWLKRAGWITPAAVAVCMIVCPAIADALPIQAEAFDSEPAPRGWTGSLNTSGGNSYGYSAATQHAGGLGAGEAGGTFARLTTRHFYADTTLGGSLDLDDPIQSSGSFFIGNRVNASTSQQVGFLNTAGAIGSNIMGIVLGEPAPSSSDYRVRLRLRLGDGTELTTANQTNFSDGQYSWALDYDPTAGVAGVASLDIFDSLGSPLQNHSINLLTSHRFIGATFDAFGLLGFSAAPDNATETYDLFIDDLTYSVAAVPEPSTLALCLVGICTLGIARSRSFSRRLPKPARPSVAAWVALIYARSRAVCGLPKSLSFTRTHATRPRRSGISA